MMRCRSLKEALKLQTARVGPVHADTIDVENTLGFALIRQDKLAEAETLSEEDLPSVRCSFAPG